MQRSLREIAWVGSRTRATPNWRQTGWRRSSHRATGLVRCWRRWVSGSTRASGSSGCLIPSVPTRGSTVRTGPCRSWDRTRSWTPRMSSQAFAVRCVTSCSPFDFNSFSWGGRTRTSNFPVNSRAVCQLTYTPMPPSLPRTASAACAKRIRSMPLLDTVVRRAAVNRSEGPGKLAPPEPLGAGGAFTNLPRRYAARPPEFEFRLRLRFKPRTANVIMGQQYYRLEPLARDPVPPVIAPATPADLPAILQLLEVSKLPRAELERHIGTTLVAKEGKQLVGTAALEL